MTLRSAPSEALVISEVTFPDVGQFTGIVVVVVVVVEVVVGAVLTFEPPPEEGLVVLTVEEVRGIEAVVGVINDDAVDEDVGEIELIEATHFNFPDTF
jgi:hypothetical protein